MDSSLISFSELCASCCKRAEKWSTLYAATGAVPYVCETTYNTLADDLRVLLASYRKMMYVYEREVELGRCKDSLASVIAQVEQVHAAMTPVFDMQYQFFQEYNHMELLRIISGRTSSLN